MKPRYNLLLTLLFALVLVPTTHATPLISFNYGLALELVSSAGNNTTSTTYQLYPLYVLSEPITNQSFSTNYALLAGFLNTQPNVTTPSVTTPYVNTPGAVPPQLITNASLNEIIQQKLKEARIPLWVWILIAIVSIGSMCYVAILTKKTKSQERKNKKLTKKLNKQTKQTNALRKQTN